MWLGAGQQAQQLWPVIGERALGDQGVETDKQIPEKAVYPIN